MNIGKLAGWAAREASEFASKNNVPIQKAIEAIEEKYGQRIYKKIASPVFTPEEKSILSSEKGKRVYFPPQEGPLPRKGDDRSLTEIQGEQRARALPGVFESVGARESSKYAEGLSARQRAVPAVDESITARETSRYKEPNVTGQKQLQNVQESTIARDASKYKEANIPPSKGTVMYSEGETNPVYLGRNPDVKNPFTKKQAAGLSGALASGGAALAGLDYFSQQALERQALERQSLTPKENKNLVPDRYKKSDSDIIQPTFNSEKSNYSNVPGEFNVNEFAEAVKNLNKAPTSTVKDTAKKALATTDTAVEEAQKAADKGEIPQVEADRFKQERDKAYQMYNEAKTRNEWLELAQLLGQTVTQYGAAQVGMRTGRSMAGLQIPSVDYGTRTVQEQKLLESRLRDIGQEQEREETLAERLRREKRDAAADARAERELRLKEKEAATPKETAEEKELRKEKKAEEKEEYKRTLSALDEVVGAQEILANENTTEKEKQDANKNLLQKANKAGLNIAKIRLDNMEPGGWFSSPKVDQAAVLTTIRQSIENLKSSRRVAPSSDTMVRMKAPNGAIGEIPESQVKAAEDQGYERVK
jgi:hypothetical protein